MVDGFGIIVAIMLFLAALIFTVFDRAANAYLDYSFLKKQYEWQIQFANTQGNEGDRLKHEFLLRQLNTEHWPKTKGALILFAVTLMAIFALILVLGSSLSVFAKIPQTNEISSNNCQNITYVVNNYYNNYTIEQITIKNENRPFSVEELKYFMRPGISALS